MHISIPFRQKSNQTQPLDASMDGYGSLYSSDSGEESTGSELDIAGYIAEINTCYGTRAAQIAHRCVADIKASRPDEKHMVTCANADVANALITQN